MAPAAAEPDERVFNMAVASRLQEKYRKEVMPVLLKEFHYKSPMQVPGMVKITVNMGVGEAVLNAKALDAALGELTRIAGQNRTAQFGFRLTF